MKKTFTGCVVVATIAGSLTATPASAQRGVAAPGAIARPLRSRSGALRRFWQLRTGDAAFLGRQWVAGSPGAGLRMTACEFVRQT